jgi:ferredoxin-NADP reductase
VAPPGAGRPAGRLTADDLAPAIVPGATAFVCGSSGFADAATELLTGLGVPFDRIRVERFGPTGGPVPPP